MEILQSLYIDIDRNIKPVLLNYSVDMTMRWTRMRKSLEGNSSQIL